MFMSWLNNEQCNTDTVPSFSPEQITCIRGLSIGMIGKREQRLNLMICYLLNFL